MNDKINEIKEYLLTNYNHLIEKNLPSFEKNDINFLKDNYIDEYNLLLKNIVNNPNILSNCYNYNNQFIIDIFDNCIYSNQIAKVFHKIPLKFRTDAILYKASKSVDNFLNYIDKEKQTIDIIDNVIFFDRKFEDFKLIREDLINDDIIIQFIQDKTHYFDSIPKKYLSKNLIKKIINTLTEENNYPEIINYFSYDKDNFQEYVNHFLKFFPTKIILIDKNFLNVQHWKNAIDKEVSVLKYLNCYDNEIINYSIKLYGLLTLCFLNNKNIQNYLIDKNNENLLSNVNICLTNFNIKKQIDASTYNYIAKISILANNSQLNVYDKFFVTDNFLIFAYENNLITENNVKQYSNILKHYYLNNNNNNK